MPLICHLWWCVVRFIFFLIAPWVFFVCLGRASSWFGWQINYGSIFIISALIVCAEPIVMLAAMLPSTDTPGTQLPTDFALRLRRISGALSITIISFGPAAPLLGIFFHFDVEAIRTLGRLVALLYWLTLLLLYFTRCPACRSFSVSIRPFYPEGTICRCRNCGAFSLWRSRQ